MRLPLVVAVVAAVASLALPHDARAGACPDLVAVHAAGQRLAPGAVFLVEARGGADLEPALAVAHLVGRGVDVGVRVVRVLHGGRTQALLAADGPLPDGAIVHLVVGIPELDERLARLELTTTSTAAGTPRWPRAPTVGKRTRIPGHKGDSIDRYAIRVPLDAGTLVAATITTPGATAEVIGVVDGGAIAIGQTGCHSMWWPHDRAARTAAVTLRALAADGSEVPAPGKPLRLRF